MRFRFLLPLLITVFATGSCSNHEPECPEAVLGSINQLVFTGEFNNIETKTVLQSNEKSISWSRNDAISIYYGASEGSRFVATNTEDMFDKANFQGTLSMFTGEIESGEAESFWAVYPFDAAVSCNGVSVVANLLSQQTATKGSFANNTAICIANSPGMNLSFYNTCSFFRFTVVKEGVKKVVFRGNSGEDVAGTFRDYFGQDNRPVDPEVIEGEKEIILEAPQGQTLEVGQMYYITLLPQVFVNGFTVSLYTDTEVGSRCIDGSHEFIRAFYITGRSLDANVQYESNNPVITYTTSDNLPVTLNSDDAFDSEIISHEYENGTGIIAFSGDLTEIGSEAFMGCSNLKTITIPETVTTIGADAFRETGLKGIVIPASVESVGIGAFASCPDLSSISVSPGNEYLDSRDDCNAIIETGSNLLIAGCQNTIIPDDIAGIGRMAFYGCSNLESLVIPNSVNVIEEYTFYGCYSLDRIAIPDALAEIGEYAFYGCSGLNNISILAFQYVPKYFYLPATVTSIGKYAFSGCTNIIDISVPESVTDVGEYAFSGCTSLSSAYFYSGNEIADYLFYGCTSLGLGEVRFPDSVTSIGDHAFDGCTSLQWLFIPRYLERIGSFAFNGCSSLTGLAIRDTVTEIGNNAFSGCSSLGFISIPSSVTVIEDYTFYGCSSLETPILQSTITRIGAYAFSGCDNFPEFTIPASVTEIGDYAFSNCSSMTQFIAYPSMPPTTGTGIFDGCKELTTIRVAVHRNYRGQLPWMNYSVLPINTSY